MRTPPRRPRITRKAQKASQREAKTPDGWDNWVQCTDKFHWWLNKEHAVLLQCLKRKGHDGNTHKAHVKGGVVEWKTSNAHAAEKK
jgi:hypothetical protein